MNQPYQELSHEQSRQVCRNLGQLANRLGITQQAIAGRTGYQRSNVGRLFSGQHAPRLDVILTVLQAISELSGQAYALHDIEPQPTPE